MAAAGQPVDCSIKVPFIASECVLSALCSVHWCGHLRSCEAIDMRLLHVKLNTFHSRIVEDDSRAARASH